MIKIYCLVDPRNNKPFYVGATCIKLNARLSAHIAEAKKFIPNPFAHSPISYQKYFLIKELTRENIKPRIDLLYSCSIHSVDYYESFFHQVLTIQGFILFNLVHQFNYTKYAKIDYYQISKNNSKNIW